MAPALASARGAPWRRTAAYFAGATRWRGRGEEKWTRGEYFGESSLLTNEPRGLGVRAVGLASAVTLSRDAIARTVGSLGEVQRAWKRTAVESV